MNALHRPRLGRFKNLEEENRKSFGMVDRLPQPLLFFVPGDPFQTLIWKKLYSYIAFLSLNFPPGIPGRVTPLIMKLT